MGFLDTIQSILQLSNAVGTSMNAVGTGNNATQGDSSAPQGGSRVWDAVNSVKSQNAVNRNLLTAQGFDADVYSSSPYRQDVVQTTEPSGKNAAEKTEEQSKKYGSDEEAESSSYGSEEEAESSSESKPPYTPEDLGLPDTTDPWTLYMPSGYQLDQLTPAEREDWQNRTTAGLLGTTAIASLPLSVIAGLGAAGAGAGATAARFVPGLVAGGLGVGAAADSMDSNKKVKEEQELAEKAREAGVTPDQLIYGKTPAQISQMYEDAIYDAAMADKAYRDAFEAAGYLDDYGSFGAYGSLGDTLDYESRRDITRDIFGLNEGDNPLEIKGLKDIYFENGTINKNMTNDEMLDAILEAHWGAENIVDPYKWLSDTAYQREHQFGGTTAGDAYAQYWLDSGMIPPMQEGADSVFAGLGHGWNNLDNKDLAALINAGNVINQANSGRQFTDYDMEALSDVFGAAGDTARFGFLPEDTDEYEGLYGREWNPGTNDYSAYNVLSALADAERGNYYGLNPYLSYGLALGDEDMTDTVMAAIQKNDKKGRKIGRS